jgi:hypothetical protein
MSLIEGVLAFLDRWYAQHPSTNQLGPQVKVTFQPIPRAGLCQRNAAWPGHFSTGFYPENANGEEECREYLCSLTGEVG